MITPHLNIGRQHLATDVVAFSLVSLAVVAGGLMIGTELWIPLVAIVFFGIALITNVTFLLAPPTTRTYLPIAIAVTLISPAIQKTTGIPVGYIAEALFVLLALPLAKALFGTARRDPYLLLSLLAFCIFLGFALASSVVEHSKRLAAAWQFFYDLKWLFMLSIGLLTTWDDQTQHLLRKLICWSWTLILPLVLFEAVAPGVYNTVMNATPLPHDNPLLGGLIAHLRGPFVHSSYVSSFSSFMAAGCLIFSRTEGWSSYAFPFASYFALMMMAGERQEFADWIVLMCILLWLEHRSARLVLPTMAGFGIVGLIALTEYSSIGFLRKLAAEWNFSGLASGLSERGILTLYGAKIANMNFPFGSGLGTYGGAGAQKFDQSLFIQLGFLRYWWFREGQFLVDTYWPNFIAESGWIGAGCALVANIVIGLRLWLLAYRPQDNNRRLFLLAFSAFLVMFMDTMTKGMIADPRGVFIFWIVIGMAIRTALPTAIAPNPMPLVSSGRFGSLGRTA
jgi:hypothetical protein